MERDGFVGKRAVVTGGNRGIGRGIAEALASRGCSLCIVGRDATALSETRRAIEAVGGTCETISADLSQTRDTERAAQQIVALEDRWDFLVNSAGNAPAHTILETPVEYWDDTFAIHCRAPFLLAKALVPGMINHGDGVILNISSNAGLRAFPAHAAYSSAKAAMNMMTQSMTVEWAQYGIRINAITPTAVMTDMGREVWGNHPKMAEWLLRKIPAGRFAEVDDVVRLALFLLGPDSAFLNGTIIPCDGGILAGVVDGPPEED